MNSHMERAQLLKNLHVKGDPLILFNIWDAGSARTIAETGAKAIATSSWSVAAAHGYDDGEKIPFDLVLESLKQIISSVNLPVTIDLEGGYGQSATEVQKNVSKIIEAGAVGINFEDQIIGTEGLYSIEEQSKRIQAIYEIAEQISFTLFINARTDIFLKNDAKNNNDLLLDEAVNRAVAYAKAGASGFFAPGLRDVKYIEKLCELSPIPVNIMMMPDMPSSQQITQLGVSRISHGPAPYCHVMDALKKAGRNALHVQ